MNPEYIKMANCNMFLTVVNFALFNSIQEVRKVNFADFSYEQRNIITICKFLLLRSGPDAFLTKIEVLLLWFYFVKHHVMARSFLFFLLTN